MKLFLHNINTYLFIIVAFKLYYKYTTNNLLLFYYFKVTTNSIYSSGHN